MVEGESLGAALVERVEDDGGRVPAVWSAVVFELVVVVGVDGVEPVGVSASGEADVAGLSRKVVGAEEQAVVDGASLSFVDGDGVAVSDPPVLHIGAIEGPGP